MWFFSSEKAQNYYVCGCRIIIYPHNEWVKVYIVYKNDIMIKYEGWGRECGDEEVIKAGAPTHTHTHRKRRKKKNVLVLDVRGLELRADFWGRGRLGLFKRMKGSGIFHRNDPVSVLFGCSPKPPMIPKQPGPSLPPPPPPFPFFSSTYK